MPAIDYYSELVETGGTLAWQTLAVQFRSRGDPPLRPDISTSRDAYENPELVISFLACSRGGGNVADLEDFVFWTRSLFLRGVEDREESTLVQGNYVDEVKSYSRRGFQTRNLCRLFGLLFVIF